MGAHGPQATMAGDQARLTSSQDRLQQFSASSQADWLAAFDDPAYVARLLEDDARIGSSDKAALEKLMRRLLTGKLTDLHDDQELYFAQLQAGSDMGSRRP